LIKVRTIDRAQAATERNDKGTECEASGSNDTAEGKGWTYAGVPGEDAESSYVQVTCGESEGTAAAEADEESEHYLPTL
jgi:hypothetical protein